MKSYIETTCPTATPSSSTRSCSRGWGRSSARTWPSIARVGQVAERDPLHQRLGHYELDQDLVVHGAAHRQRRIAHAPHAAEIKSKHIPWSVTLMTLAFVSAVVKDDAYLQQTSDACNLAKKHGGPERSAKPGYNFPAFLRIAVRSPKQTAVLHRVEAAVRRVPDGAHPMGGHTSDTQLANAAFISDSAISPAASNGDSNENDSRPEVCTATEMNEMKKQFEQQAHEIGALKQ
ncbi:hypothetical protein PF004_g5614 [Phytophthora fragariae]|uniref:Uncharacterized protein n=1 Tax=Phytophthora fragariae TaxID=53985 RepID=A0A6G0PF41_9STRA|nr:hypothetical protein PF004_g5614 [Phytophthora fragariae]